MLQALGSNTKTKIAYAMFSGCCFMIAGAFFVARMERVEFDDSYAYCATVYYSPKTGYRVEYWGQRNDFDKISTGCARACFKDRKSTNGLYFLEIETQPGYRDQHQAFAAGILEGSLTWKSIYAQWMNTIQSFCEKNEENQKFCDWLRDIVTNNYKNVLKLAKEKDRTDYYHHQVFLFYHQMLGIETGFKKGVRRARRDFDIPFVDFLLLNSRTDIEDLKLYYNEYVVDHENDMLDINPRVGKMVLKVEVDEDSHSTILVGHSADGEYNSMLKIVKTYRFNFHHGPEASTRLVTNTDITFTSFPGSIASSDDFYLAMGKHTRVIVTGITLKHHNSVAELMHGIDLEGTIFSSARVMAAIRLSHNGKFFSRVMARDPDIGAKQWLVVDEKRMKFLAADSSVISDGTEAVTSSTTTDSGLTMDNAVPNDSITPLDLVKSTPSTSNRNLVWLIDQTWRRLHAEDVTSKFRNEPDGWILDGTPYFKVIQDLNGLQPRSIRVETTLENLDDVVQFLKDKSYRGDLMSEPTTFGNVDLKLYTSDDHELIVQNGPITSETSPPFDWSSTDFAEVRHDEHPTVWNFSPIEVEFLWS